MPAHFSAFDALVRAASRGDVRAARGHAQDLTADPAAADADATARVGAAAGFLQIATDGPDLALGVAKAAAACAECHREHNALTPSGPPATHALAATRLAWQAAWAVAAEAPADLPEPAASVWGDLSEALQACQGCHARTTDPAPEP